MVKSVIKNGQQRDKEYAKKTDNRLQTTQNK